MPLSLRRGTVTAIVEPLAELVRLEVDGIACIAYPRVTGPVELGDDVVVNGQARELGLGSGGFDVLHVNLTRGLALEPEAGAHVMTLPYTSLQHAVPHGEEDALAESLAGMPVVCCSLHSQVVPVCAALSAVRVAYVQVAGGALPVSLSDAVRALRGRRLLAFTVAAAPCLDADVQVVNVYSALAYAAAAGAEAIVCAIGPGIVGTGTALGHGGLAAAQAVDAVAALGGRAVLAPRVSRSDARPRHRGLSHHTQAILRVCLAAPLVPDELEPERWREECAGLPLSHMGRGPDDDPDFFAAAFAAGHLARSLLT
ncbi:MAG: DUF3866 family protein [Gaiellaceae bacterium]|jgi:hypothetical protein